MTVDEFHEWTPPAGLETRQWQLVNGEPVCMAPAGLNHGAIQGEAFLLIRTHLRAAGSSCWMVIAPGVIPGVDSSTNELVPDLGVSCAPRVDDKVMRQPVLLVEIMSPSNKKDTDRNILAYTTMPSVQEILVLESLSVSARLYRRTGQKWEADPIRLDAASEVRLQSIGFAAQLVDFYAGSTLAMP